MAVIIGEQLCQSLAPEIAAGWRDIPTSVISDELNRSGSMVAAIKPLDSAWRLAGPAMTVQTMPADNLAIHHAVAMASAGCVLVVDSGVHDRNAVWGGILHKAAQLRGIAGVIIDGAVRDSRELLNSKMPCFARAVVSGGPQKGWGGSINMPIQVGGCAVSPGDIVVGDADGVVVIPRLLADGLLDSCRRRILLEEDILLQLESGRTTVDIFKLTP